MKLILTFALALASTSALAGPPSRVPPRACSSVSGCEQCGQYTSVTPDEAGMGGITFASKCASVCASAGTACSSTQRFETSFLDQQDEDL